MSESILRDQSKEFAKNIIFMCKDIQQKHKDYVLSNQLLRSGTSIGANIHEAQYAQGKKDFISKLEIALKECNETEYWLDLLESAGYVDEDSYKRFRNECSRLRRMLISSVTTVKSKM